MLKDMNRRVAVRAIIYKEGKIFALRQIKKGNVNKYWSTPGGGLHPMESLQAGLTREMVEETGVKPVIGSLLFVQQYKENETDEQLEFFFHVTNINDYENIDLRQTTHGELEISQYGFINPKESPLLPRFLQETNLEEVITNSTVEVFNYL